MEKLRPEIPKAVMESLLSKDKEGFLDNMSVLIGEYPKFIDFLIDGTLPVNDSIKEQLIEIIKKTKLVCPEDFKGLVSVKTGFNYDLSCLYKVVYKAVRYYDTNKHPYNGLPAIDNEHPIQIVTNMDITIYPQDLNN